MQRWERQASLKVGLSPAVSTRALNSVRRLSVARKPHCMGNTALRPFASGAMTGTTSVGRTSPSVITGRAWVSTNLCASRDRNAASIISLSSGRSFSKAYLVHIAVLQNFCGQCFRGRFRVRPTCFSTEDPRRDRCLRGSFRWFRPALLKARRGSLSRHRRD